MLADTSGNGGGWDGRVRGIGTGFSEGVQRDRRGVKEVPIVPWDGMCVHN